MNHHNPQNIRRGISVLGIAALLVGVATASILYWSFGVTLAERGVYALVGVIFATAGGLLLPAAVALWQSERPGAAAGVFMFWLAAILPLGLSGHAGFFSLAQSELAAQSIPAQAERARLESIETQLQAAGGAAGADVGGLESRASALREQLRAARDSLAACPANYITKCIAPAKAAVAALQSELQPIEAALSGHARYSALQSQRADTISALSAASSGAVGDGGYHPLFSTLARLLDVEAGRLQAVFLAWSAVALELVAALAFIIAGALQVQGEYAPPARSFAEPEQEAQARPFGFAPDQATATAQQASQERQGALGASGLMSWAERVQQRQGAAAELSAATVATAATAAATPEVIYKTVGRVANCQHCGAPFTATRSDKKYCGSDCRARAWEARTGRTFKRAPGTPTG